LTEEALAGFIAPEGQKKYNDIRGEYENREIASWSEKTWSTAVHNV
jgi:hypothetical protein